MDTEKFFLQIPLPESRLKDEMRLKLEGVLNSK
jgi:hypothetical protein